MAIAPGSRPAASEKGANKGADGAVLNGLRALLAEKFPQAASHEAGRYTVPLPEGGSVELPLGGVTEVTGSLATGGLFLEAVLRATYARRGMMALVDARGSFDPAALLGGRESGDRFTGERLERLLWVACEKVEVALRAADLLLRDGNLSTIVLDVQMTPLAELRRIPANTWYRFQRIVEPTSLLFVVLTPVPMIAAAAERLELHGEWNLSAMREVRAELPIPVQRSAAFGVKRPSLHSSGESGRRIA